MFGERGIIFFTVTVFAVEGCKGIARSPLPAWRKRSVMEERCSARGYLTVGSGPPVWLVRLWSVLVPGVEEAVAGELGDCHRRSQ